MHLDTPSCGTCNPLFGIGARDAPEPYSEASAGRPSAALSFAGIPECCVGTPDATSAGLPPADEGFGLAGNFTPSPAKPFIRPGEPGSGSGFSSDDSSPGEVVRIVSVRELLAQHADVAAAAGLVAQDADVAAAAGLTAQDADVGAAPGFAAQDADVAAAAGPVAPAHEADLPRQTPGIPPTRYTPPGSRRSLEDAASLEDPGQLTSNPVESTNALPAPGPGQPIDSPVEHAMKLHSRPDPLSGVEWRRNPASCLCRVSREAVRATDSPIPDLREGSGGLSRAFTPEVGTGGFTSDVTVTPSRLSSATLHERPTAKTDVVLHPTLGVSAGVVKKLGMAGEGFRGFDNSGTGGEPSAWKGGSAPAGDPKTSGTTAFSRDGDPAGPWSVAAHWAGEQPGVDHAEGAVQVAVPGPDGADSARKPGFGGVAYGATGTPYGGVVVESDNGSPYSSDPTYESDFEVDGVF
jgi:hypothetical protein